MRFGEGGRKVDGGGPLAAYGCDGNVFLACRRADHDPVAYSETLRPAYADPVRSGADRSGEVGPARCCAHMRHSNSFDSVANAVDIQPDLVTDGDIRESGDLDVAGSGRRIHGEPGLGAWLA